MIEAKRSWGATGEPEPDYIIDIRTSSVVPPPVAVFNVRLKPFEAGAQYQPKEAIYGA
jgi:hypothetical protein